MGRLYAKVVWTEAETAYLRGNYPASSLAEIAVDLGMAWSRVNTKAHQLGLRRSRRVPRGQPGTKWCSGCRAFRPVAEFHVNRTMPDGLQYICRACAVAKATEWARRNPERFRANAHRAKLKKAYGLTPEGVEVLRTRQQGRCAICQRELTPANTVVDHCHTTGRVRGLLCRSCNTGIGIWKDSIELLQTAIAYLNR